MYISPIYCLCILPCNILYQVIGVLSSRALNKFLQSKSKWHQTVVRSIVNLFVFYLYSFYCKKNALYFFQVYCTRETGKTSLSPNSLPLSVASWAMDEGAASHAQVAMVKQMEINYWPRWHQLVGLMAVYMQGISTMCAGYSPPEM